MVREVWGWGVPGPPLLGWPALTPCLDTSLGLNGGPAGLHLTFPWKPPHSITSSDPDPSPSLLVCQQGGGCSLIQPQS